MKEIKEIKEIKDERLIMKVDLLDTLAKVCYYAQSNVCDPQAWTRDVYDRSCGFNNVSYIIACFLSNHTVYGDDGVEGDIVLSQLSNNKLNKDGDMLKSEKKWKKIIERLVEDFGGLKEQ